jgi:hypothetical protein
VTEYKVTTVDDETVTYAIVENNDRTLEGEHLQIKCCVIGIGHYGDMTIHNPYTGKHLWVGASVDMTENIYEASRRLFKVAEQLKFLGDPSSTIN